MKSLVKPVTLFCVFFYLSHSSAFELTKENLEYLAPYDWSLGVSINANLLHFGEGISFESVTFGDKTGEAGEYCAYTLDALFTASNVGASISLSKLFGYKKPEDYTGYALVAAINLPFKVGTVQYSRGANFNEAIDVLEKQKRYGDFDPSKMTEEMLHFFSLLVHSEIPAQEKARIKAIACEVGGLLNSKLVDNSCQNSNNVSFTDKPFPAQAIKSQYQAKELNPWLEADFSAMHKFLKKAVEMKTFQRAAPNFQKFFNAIVGSLTDASAIAIAGGVGWSPNPYPVTLAVQIAHYTLIHKRTNVPIQIARLANFSTENILQMFTEAKDATVSGRKHLLNLCKTSREIIKSDNERFAKVMLEPITPVKLSIPLESYFVPQKL